MKTNTLVKYQLYDMKYVFIILYSILLFVNLTNGALLVINGEKNSNSGMDISCMFTFFITAICCYAETFEMWLQNGLCRKNIFKGLWFGSLSISAICSIVTYALTQISNIIFPLPYLTRKGFFLSDVFQNYFEKNNFLTELFANLAFTLMSTAAAIMLGYLIASLFYRSGKIVRIGIAAGLPIFTFAILPVLISVFYQTEVLQKILSFFYTIFGLKSGNPSYLILTITFLFFLLSAANYLIIKKLQIRTAS